MSNETNSSEVVTSVAQVPPALALKKSKNWVFTCNNYTPGAEWAFQNLECDFMCYGREVGKEGTPHLQGMVCFKNALSHKSVCAHLPGCWTECCIDTLAAYNYCVKDGNVFERGIRHLSATEHANLLRSQKDQGKKGASHGVKGASHGVKGGEAERKRWQGILSNCKAGDFESICPKVQVIHCKSLDYIYNQALLKGEVKDSTKENFWYWGESGAGKSRSARAELPDAYLKMCNKWWDGYIPGQTVLIEDFDRQHNVLCHHLKIWADRYPFTAEKKGASAKIRPQRIVVTSNWHPSQIWQVPGDLEPILRRFTCVHFGANPDYQGFVGEEWNVRQGNRIINDVKENLPNGSNPGEVVEISSDDGEDEDTQEIEDESEEEE